MGCPCHMAHSTAKVAADALLHETAFDIEELVLDLFYWFDKSPKRKSSLSEYCCFCDIHCQKIVKHISIQWLSLKAAVEQVSKVYSGLISYFLTESFWQAWFEWLRNLFNSHIVYLLFFQSMLQVFNHFNVFLQREDPCIHLVHDHCESLLRKILGKIMKTDVIAAANMLSEMNTIIPATSLMTKISQ